MALKIANLSHSSITSFLQCPRSWAARNIEGVMDVKGEEAQFGDAFDKLVGEAVGFPVKEYRASDGKKVKAEPGEYRKKYATPEVDRAIEHYLAQPWAWTKCKDMQTFIQITPMQWEKLAEKYGANPYLPDRIVGFVDMIRYTPESEGLPDELRPIELCDLKTTVQDNWKAEWARQCVLYCLATGATRWSIHRFVRGRPEKLGCRTVEMNCAESAQLVREVMDHTAYYAQQIKVLRDDPSGVDNLPRNSGFHCKYCPLADSCKSGEPFKGGVLPGKFKWARGTNAGCTEQRGCDTSVGEFLGGTP